MTDSIKYIFSTIKSSFLPACCFALGLAFFFGYYPYEFSTNNYLHFSFYALSFLSLIVLFFINRSKPFLTVLTGVICYILLNRIKLLHPNDFFLSAQYIWLCLLLPLNLAVFYFLPTSKLKQMSNFYLFVFMLAQISCVSKFGDFILQSPLISITVGIMPLWVAAAWIVVLVSVALDISFRSTVINTGLFYADSALFFALIYADSASACTTFFLTFALISDIAAILDLRHLYHFDYLDGVGSYQAYLTQASKKFPFKYTIGLLCIDNREEVFQKLGKRRIKILEQMIVNRIKDFPYKIEIFRHERNELILVFKNETAKQVIDYAEEIRRTLTGSEFVFSDKNVFKITVSICVSEKTRKDLDAAEVINRAHITLQKANSLNSNICMKA